MIQTRIGHAHLKVRDLARAQAFYEQFLGLRVTERVGNHYVFMTAGALHHEIALQKVDESAPQPSRHATGLFHVAFEVPDKTAFAHAYALLQQHNVPVVITDHRISWAMYFTDPDGNGIEIYCDTRHEDGGSDTWEGWDRPLCEETVLRLLPAAP